MTSCRKEITKFMAGCETLLDVGVVASNLTHTEHQIIEYYLAALSAKFPAIIDTPLPKSSEQGRSYESQPDN